MGCSKDIEGDAFRMGPLKFCAYFVIFSTMISQIKSCTKVEVNCRKAFNQVEHCINMEFEDALSDYKCYQGFRKWVEDRREDFHKGKFVIVRYRY